MTNTCRHWRKEQIEGNRHRCLECGEEIIVIITRPVYYLGRALDEFRKDQERYIFNDGGIRDGR